MNMGGQMKVKIISLSLSHSTHLKWIVSLFKNTHIKPTITRIVDDVLSLSCLVRMSQLYFGFIHSSFIIPLFFDFFICSNIGQKPVVDIGQNIFFAFDFNHDDNLGHTHTHTTQEWFFISHHFWLNIIDFRWFFFLWNIRNKEPHWLSWENEKKKKTNFTKQDPR